MFLNLPLSLFSHLLGAGVEIGKLEMKPRNRVTAWWGKTQKGRLQGRPKCWKIMLTSFGRNVRRRSVVR